MKILIIRFSSIGDIVITSPVVRCVRQANPDAIIHFLTKKNFSYLLDSCQYVDEVLTLDGSINDIMPRLKEEDYDVVIDLHKNLRTRAIRNALKAKWYSYDKLNVKKWLWVNFRWNRMPDEHLVDRYFEGLKSLNITNDGKGLEYFLPHSYSYDISAHELSHNAYIAISIGGTYATKRMPNHMLIDLINRIDRPVVLLGGGAVDEANAQVISEAVGAGVVNLVNQISVHDAAYVIEHAAQLITGDTGMMHIAAAFGTPIQAVWGNTHPLLGMYAYQPESQNNVVDHQVELPCRPCSKLGSDQCPRGHFNCMELQNVEEIVQNCP